MTIPIAHTGPDGQESQLLHDHLVEVSHRAAVFASAWGKPAWSATAGRWHDLGKYAADVQIYLSGVTDASRGPDHSSAGAIHAARELRARGSLLAYAIAGHHTGLPDWDGVTAGASTLSRRLEKVERLDAVLIANPRPDLLAPIPLEPLDREADLSLLTRMIFSTLIDADRLDTEAFVNPEQHRERQKSKPIASLAWALNIYLDRLSAEALPTPVNTARAALLEACRRKASSPRGLFSLTAPTGLGKTLSGLTFALEHAQANAQARVIYVAPYTSIIEQTAEVFRSALGADAVLEHHSNLDPDDDKTTRAQRLATENWDATLIVTTAVQFFESLFSAKTRNCRKLHRIANSVVFLDEAQLLPPEFLMPILRALDELLVRFRVSVILSTATQPALDARPGFPGLNGRNEIVLDPSLLNRSMRRVRVVLPQDLDTTTTWSDLAARLAQHPSLLCIVDRRSDARTLHALLPSGALHLSALMCPAHRASLIADVRQRLACGEQLRLVSTQLIEAGVDLDFPVVYRALAGLDSLAQAAGRCNREGRLESGLMHVFVPPKPPPRGHLRQAAAIARLLLSRRPEDPFTPEIFDEFFRQLFWLKGPDLDRHEICKLLPRCPSHDEGFQFRTAGDRFRLIEDSASVLVPYGEGEKLIARIAALAGNPDVPRGDLYRRAQRYRVGIPRQMLTGLENDNVIRRIDHDLWAAEPHAYRSDYGLDLAGRIEPEGLIV